MLINIPFHFQAWRDNVFKRSSLVNTMSEAKYYEEIYGRYLRVSHVAVFNRVCSLMDELIFAFGQNEAQSEVAKGTRAGKVFSFPIRDLFLTFSDTMKFVHYLDERVVKPSKTSYLRVPVFVRHAYHKPGFLGSPWHCLPRM